LAGQPREQILDNYTAYGEDVTKQVLTENSLRTLTKLRSQMNSIENISHACLKYRCDSVTLLTDPWIVDEPIKSKVIYKFPPQLLSPEDACSGVDFVYISHTHEDHFHIPSILHLPKSVKFLVSDYSFAPHQCERNLLLIKTLNHFGYKNIHILQPWEWFEISETFRVCLIPSASSRFMDWENTGLAVDMGGHVSLNMNDNVVDRDLCLQIAELLPKINIYFIQTAGLSTFPACFDLSDEEKAAALNGKTNNFSMHDLVIDLLQPEFLVPYAGDFGWFGEFSDLTFNSRQTPLPLLKYIESKGLVKTTIFEPGDTIFANEHNTEVRTLGNIDWNDPATAYKKAEKKYAKFFTKEDQKFRESSLADHSDSIDDYFRDIGDWHKNFGPTTNFSASMTYRIYDSEGEILWLVTANNGQRLELKKVNRVDDDTPQVHNIRVCDFLSVLTGDYMMSEIQWRTKISQRIKCDSSVLLIFFINYYFDKANRTPQYRVTELCQSKPV
jgi:hypothetical protein